MASDGCQPLGVGQMPVYGRQGCWVNENAQSPYPSYADRREPDFQVQRRSGNTGTWHGPAPVGNPSMKGITQDPTPTAPAPRAQPGIRDSEVLLRSGSRLPFLALCTENATEADVAEALKIGYRHIDCSPENNNQVEVGKALASVPREQLFVTSKLSNDDHGGVEAACKKTLNELGLDYLDMYLIAWPVAWKKGTQTPDEQCTIESTWKGMEALVTAGLVRNIGVANFSLPEVETILQSCSVKPAVIQIELHPLNAQRKLVGVCKRLGLQIQAHHPLGGAKVDCLGSQATKSVAASCGQTAAQVLLKWNMQRGVAVLVNPKHVGGVSSKELHGALSFMLTNDEKRELDAVNTDTRCFEPSWAKFADPEQGGAAKPSVVLGY